MVSKKLINKICSECKFCNNGWCYKYETNKKEVKQNCKKIIKFMEDWLWKKKI